MALLDTAQKAWLYPPDGRAPVSIRDRGGQPVAFGANASAFVVRPGPDRALRIEREDLLTGAHTPVATISVPERTGLVRMYVSSVVGQPGRYGYAYGYMRQLSTLLVASGISAR